MNRLRRSTTAAAIAVLLASATLATLGSFWLWGYSPLYAALLCAFLLFGGARTLPSRNGLAYSASLGLCIGVFLGGASGAARYFYAG
jgi:hypothetical protein